MQVSNGYNMLQFLQKGEGFRRGHVKRIKDSVKLQTSMRYALLK